MHAILSPAITTPEEEWADCERQLHATAMPDVQRYEADLRALRAVVDRLKDVDTIGALIENWTSTTWTDTDRRAILVRGAAFAVRGREIRTASDMRMVEGRVALARKNGETWTVLQETGARDADAIAAFSTTTMHLSSGLAILSMGHYAPMSDRLAYALAVIRLAPDTGALIDANPGLEDWLETPDRGELEVAIEKWRGQIEAGIGQG